MLFVSVKRKESIGWEELNHYGRCDISWLTRNMHIMVVDTNCACFKNLIIAIQLAKAVIAIIHKIL